MALLFNLEKVVGRGFADNLITLIMGFLMEYGGLIIDEIDNKVSCCSLTL
jgi:hypothetical protein